MAMKLLSKQEVQKAKTADKKVEIAEGLKLAKRIDNLREIAAQEEASLQKFRIGTIASINEEIETAAAKRDVLKTEVAVLEQKRRELQIPLDGDWEELRRADRALTVREERHAEREHEIIALELETKNAHSLAEAELEKIKQRGVLADNRLHEASLKHEQAAQSVERAQRVEEEARLFSERMSEGLTHREKELVEREKDVTLKETDLLLREQSLANGWVLLRDQEALLERNFKRLQNYGKR